MTSKAQTGSKLIASMRRTKAAVRGETAVAAITTPAPSTPELETSPGEKADPKSAAKPTRKAPTKRTAKPTAPPASKPTHRPESRVEPAPEQVEPFRSRRRVWPD